MQTRKRPVLQSGELYGYVNGKKVKYFTFDAAMKIWKVSRPTFYDWVKSKKIRTGEIDPNIQGQKPIRCVSQAEIDRVQGLINEGWMRGKAKAAKKAKR